MADMKNVAKAALEGAQIGSGVVLLFLLCESMLSLGKMCKDINEMDKISDKYHAARANVQNMARQGNTKDFDAARAEMEQLKVSFDSVRHVARNNEPMLVKALEYAAEKVR